MPDSIVLRLTRPFRSVDEFLEAEADWITHKTMLLVDTEELPIDTVIRFGVQLRNGEWAIKAEACVAGYRQQSARGPSGLVVRFKRYGAATKRIVDRAAEIRARRKATALGASSPGDSAERRTPISASTTEVEPIRVASPASKPGAAQSGVHTRVVRPVDAPVNREELLARLRKRAAQPGCEDATPDDADGSDERARRATA